MDGRVQLSVINYMQIRFDAVYVDMITEPAPNKILAEGVDAVVVDEIRRRLDVSLEKHSSCGVAIVGHEDCTANPLPKEDQVRQLEAAREFLREMYPGVEVIGLWVELCGNVEEIA
jgi:hypothetical protein